MLKASEKEYGQYIEIVQKGDDFIKPKTSDVQPEPEPIYEDFYIEALEDGTVTFSIPESLSSDISMKYKINSGEWKNCEFSNNMFTYSINSNDKIYFKGENEYISINDTNISWFNTTCDFNIGGDIMSLLNYNNTITEYGFYGIFQNCTKLISAMNLELSAVTLASNCYNGMFYNCKNLTHAPLILPAITLAEACYSYMFEGCSSLITGPELPAKILTENCYISMF